MTDTSTQAGRDKRMNEIVLDYTKNGNGRALVRLVGGSIAEYDARFDPSMTDAPRGGY